MEPWELAAREHIRDAMAQYTWSGDSGRIGDLAEAFLPEGVLEIRGGRTHRGREAITAYLGGIATTTPPAEPGRKRLVRHSIANVRFLELTPERALVASYFTVVTEVGLDHVGRYRDTLVPAGGRWLLQHRFVSTDWWAPTSTMARNV